uniref:(northern house mosquito) hypothetical protein n=1 Tax=Culex pipiens TaxID=7175 RepID=A0A8D8EUU2_CULPI
MHLTIKTLVLILDNLTTLHLKWSTKFEDRCTRDRASIETVIDTTTIDRVKIIISSAHKTHKIHITHNVQSDFKVITVITIKETQTQTTTTITDSIIALRGLSLIILRLFAIIVGNWGTLKRGASPGRICVVML